ncbi:MAG: methyl-accepting chemotaxis protein [Leucothrix sp.]
MSDQSNKAIKSGAMSIRSRVALSVTAPLLILLLVSVMSLLALKDSSTALSNLNQSTERIHKTTEVQRMVQDEFLTTLNYIKSGSLKPSVGLTRLTISRNKFASVWEDFIKPVETENADAAEEFKAGKAHLDEGLDELMSVLSSEGKDIIKAFHFATRYYIFSDTEANGAPLDKISHIGDRLLTALNERVQGNQQNNESVFNASKNNIDLSTTTIAAIILLGLLFIMIAGVLLYKSIAKPVEHLTHVVSELSDGNPDIRSRLKGKDELTQLGNTLNQMVDERAMLENKVADDNEAINHSVFSLLEAVSDLSDRDLTVRAQVTEDATGPLADAINQLAEDTTEVLDKVKNISLSVEQTAESVNERSQAVNELAIKEQAEAKETASQIERIRKRLTSIAQSAIQTNEIAEQTSGATQHAYESVSRSMSSMGEIRSTVQDTGKRIKRLGERSQEITYITDIINGIAERTTVLALNANMQAMAAGDAGKGFSVIADEIQRLAESSRESTEQISTLVKNIQQETKSTIATMDHTIEQVAEGSTLAEEATSQMQKTLDANNQLTSSVNDIANASQEQMEMGETLQARAIRIVETTDATGQEMSSLARLTGEMSTYAKQLVASVNVFKLKS